MKVNTVLGSISPEQIGIANMHEHIIWVSAGWQFSPEANELFNAPEVFQKIYEKLVEYKAAGGRTIVDCSGVGLGRDVEFYATLAKFSGVNIVACTGFYTEDKVVPYFRSKDIDYCTDFFIRELTRGMATTNVKAGIIKVANGRTGMTPFEEITYRAAARASRSTGAAIITHGVELATKQVEILLDEGVDPERVVISHCDAPSCLNFDRDKEFAKKGFYVGYDHVGVEEWCTLYTAMSDNKRIELCKAFIEAGYAKNLVISCDAEAYTVGVFHGISPHGFEYLLRNFVPRLLSVGISEEIIHLLLVENPARLLPF